MVKKQVHSLGKFNRIKEVIHLALVTRLTQVHEHVDEPAMHLALALCEEIRVNWLIAEVNIPRISIIHNAIPLHSITNALEFPTASLELALTLALGGLLVNQKALPQNPRLLPNVT